MSLNISLTNNCNKITKIYMIGNNILTANRKIILRKNNDCLRSRDYILIYSKQLSEEKGKISAIPEIALIYDGSFLCRRSLRLLTMEKPINICR